MGQLAWDESIRTGIDPIDRQHRMIIERLDFLEEAVREGKADVVIGQILTDLMEYAREHFQTEEGYFEEFGYEGKEGHCLEHRRFIQHVAELYTAFEEGRKVSPKEVLNFFSSWIRYHLWNVDREYVDFLKGAGAR